MRSNVAPVKKNSSKAPSRSSRTQKIASKRGAAPEPPQNLWVSRKLRDSLRPSIIRSEEPNDALFGEKGSSRERLATHPYIRLADTLLRSEGFEVPNEGGEPPIKDYPHRRRA